MKSTFCAIICAWLFLAAAPVVAQTGNDLFQQALVKERANGELRDAIALYERIIEEFTDDRELVARALVQMGGCYEKLGSTEAERAYRRVVQEFAEQEDLVVRARSRLAALQRAARAPEAENITTRQVWLDRSGSTEPLALTPDGRYLLFVDWGSWSSRDSEGVGDLAIHDLTTGESRLLTREAKQDDPQQWVWAASVSPDGRSVAYLWTEGGTGSLRLIGVDGSNPRVLYREAGCGFAYAPAWTHDSNHLVALHMCAGSDELLVISIEDGIARRIEAAAPLGLWGPASVSPDDRYAALEVAGADNGDSRDIWLVALEGDDARPLIQHPSDDRLIGWVPGTEDMLFLSDRDGRRDLWSVRVTGPVAEGPPRLVRRNVGDCSPLGFTGDGGLFYYVFTRRNTLSVAPFDLSTASWDEQSAVSILGFNRGAAWSPDGEYLAFVRDLEDQQQPSGYRRPLLVRHLASGAERELAPQLQAEWPKWSPDGRFILMNGYLDETDQRSDYHGGLYIVDVESGEPSPVLEPQGNEAPEAMPGGALWWWYGIPAVWASGGEAVIYSRYYGDHREGRLVWRELESGRERILYRDSLLATHLFALSPDGQRLVFGVRDSIGDFGGSVAPINTGGRLMMLDLEDGAMRELYVIREPGYVESIQWTPDGDYILFSKGETPDPHTSVWRVSADGSEAEGLWTFGAGSSLGGFALSPDGHQVAYNVYGQEYEVWVMDNLKEALERER